MNIDIDVSKFRKLDGGLLLILQELLASKSVTRTAHALNLSQSTISQALGRLRSLFDDPLFVRKPHGLEPTQHALQLEPRISLLIELASDAFNAGQSFDPARSVRTFTLSAPEFVTATMATPLLQHLEAHAPGISMSFVHMPEHDVFERLRRGEVACAIGRFEHGHPDVEQTLLYADEFCIAARRGHPVTRGRLTEKKYKAQKHVWANASTETVQRDAEFEYSDYCGHVVPRWLTALVIAAQSDYIATCPRRLAESQAGLLDLELRRLPDAEPVTVKLACRKNAHDPGVQWLVDQIHTVVS